MPLPPVPVPRRFEGRSVVVTGAWDDMVPAAQSIRLAGALGQAGATVELELVPGATHFWNGAGDVPGIVRHSVEFLRALA